MRRAKEKSFKGSRPSPCDGWQFLDEVSCDGRRWEIYFQTGLMFDGSKNGWTNLKVIVHGRIVGKANYRFGWFAPERKFSANSDIDLMKAKRPELYFNVVHKIMSSKIARAA